MTDKNEEWITIHEYFLKQPDGTYLKSIYTFDEETGIETLLGEPRISVLKFQVERWKIKAEKWKIPPNL